MNLISLNSLVCLTLFILLFNQVMECKLDKKSFCYCKPMGDDEETSSNLKKINFVNYIVSLGKLSWSLDFFTEEHKVETHLCSGVILNENYILSTASCLTTKTDIKKIGVGLNNKQNDLIAIYDEGRIPIKKTIIHEEFNAESLENDLALIELQTPINFDKTSFRPICLLDQSKYWFNRMSSYVWGNIGSLTNPIKPTDLKYLRYLKKTNLEDISYKVPDCLDKPKRLCMRSIDKPMNSENSKSDHEPGSPLLFSEDNKVTIIGLFSYYSSNRKYEMNNDPSTTVVVYTKISDYLQWIKQQIDEEFCYF